VEVREGPVEPTTAIPKDWSWMQRCHCFRDDYRNPHDYFG